MGWLDKVKNLLSKDDGPRSEEISTEKLSEWVNNETKDSIEDIKEKIKETIEEINKEREVIREKLEVLETAKLKNEKIPVKERQVMEGNRKAYVNSLDIFMNKITPPEDINYKNISNFCSDFEEMLADFTRSSAKSYYILKDFFEDEVRGIADHMKKIDSSIRELLDDDYKDIIKLKKGVANFNELLRIRENTNNKLEQEAENYKKLKMTIDKNETESEKIRHSVEYSELNKLNAAKQKKLDEMKKEEDTVIQIFSPLDTAMKKFSKITLDGEKEIRQYLESPVNALLLDKEMKILTLLQKMKDSVDSNQIELKDKKKEKTVEKIGEVSRERLESFVNNYGVLKESLGEIEKRLKLNRAMVKLEELKYMQSHLKDKLEKSSESIEKIKKNIESLKIDEARKNIEKHANEVLNVELSIK